MDVKTVAVIGAGVSGVSSAIHLRNAGLEVTVFERGDVAGGVWVYNSRTAVEPAYPATLPSTGDSPAFDSLLKTTDRHTRRDSPVDQELRDSKSDVDSSDLAILHAPPGPCYQGLHNNVSTPEMKLRTHNWEPDTPDFVTHDVLATYIQDTAAANDILSNISFRTRVNKVEKRGTKWEVCTSKLVEEAGEKEMRNTVQEFDAVIVASGHYHAPNIPDYQNLKAWKTAFPTRIMHSKLYRSPSPYAGKNVLVIGAGVSSTDICRELGGVANKIWQSSRGGEYDLLPSMLPDNCKRIGSIADFSPLDSTSGLGDDDTLPGSVILSSGDTIDDVHHIILGTGYHMSYSFLAPLHADDLLPENATETTLVTTGQVTHNLHKDIFYIPDPTLAFIDPMANNNPWLYAGLSSSFPNISRAEDNKTPIWSDLDDQLSQPQPCKTFTKPSADCSPTLSPTPISDPAPNSLIVFRYNERIYAIDQACPHQGYPMTNASLSDIEDFGIVLSVGVTCPKHGRTFDLHTGEASVSRYRLGMYEVETRVDGDGEEGVWVRKKERKRIG
ncbi:dimethylaniline monooxygenase [Aureobasidium sp. EXF-3400]|nr:dimethylaniline monooxygenase [Aureobasidium sp. EXF-12344]KAI4774359.1 dimethylaniline monooxygenase [Aureobasidium sp. EXF-3400]